MKTSKMNSLTQSFISKMCSIKLKTILFWQFNSSNSKRQDPLSFPNLISHNNRTHNQIDNQLLFQKQNLILSLRLQLNQRHRESQPRIYKNQPSKSNLQPTNKNCRCKKKSKRNRDSICQLSCREEKKMNRRN